MKILDILFPKYCVNCKKLGDYLCPDCFSRLSYDTKNICLPCGKPSYDGLTHPGCLKKSTVEGSFTGVVFNSISKKLIYQFKYRPYLSGLSPFLSDLLYESLIQDEEFNKILHSFPPSPRLRKGKQDEILEGINKKNLIFVPIPLGKKRLRKRGYNQSALLAKELSKKFSLEVLDSLERIKDTPTQVGLSKKERKENIKDAFVLKPAFESRVKRKDIFLIDDVLTTGSTFSEACSVLKRKGAGKIWAIAFAREQ